jgi:hypothetical protein
MTVKKYEHSEEAQGDIVTAITLCWMPISQWVHITEIDRKHSTYTKSSIEKIRT